MKKRKRMLWAMFIMACVLIVIVWYISKSYRYIPDSELLDLSSEEDLLVLPWINKIELTGSDMEERLLKALHIESNNIVFGKDLKTTYQKLTGNILRNNRSWFDLRLLTGFPGELAIIENDRIALQMRAMNSNMDLKNLTYIVAVDPELTVTNHIKQILDSRWETIISLNDPNVLNNSGTYLYYKSDTDTVFNNVQGLTTDKGLRINLLCSNLQFNTLIARWKQNQMIVL